MTSFETFGYRNGTITESLNRGGSLSAAHQSQATTKSSIEAVFLNHRSPKSDGVTTTGYHQVSSAHPSQLDQTPTRGTRSSPEVAHPQQAVVQLTGKIFSSVEHKQRCPAVIFPEGTGKGERGAIAGERREGEAGGGIERMESASDCDVLNTGYTRRFNESIYPSPSFDTTASSNRGGAGFLTFPAVDGSAAQPYLPLQNTKCDDRSITSWRPFSQYQHCWPYEYNITPTHQYNTSCSMLDVRRKNATRESTSTLKAWLFEHIKNPYPTKGEKIMLAIIAKMTLTQVSTWFANARRRLKKENKVNWSAASNKHHVTSDDDNDDEDDDDDNDRTNNDVTHDVSDDDRTNDCTGEFSKRRHDERTSSPRKFTARSGATGYYRQEDSASNMDHSPLSDSSSPSRLNSSISGTFLPYSSNAVRDFHPQPEKSFRAASRQRLPYPSVPGGSQLNSWGHGDLNPPGSRQFCNDRPMNAVLPSVPWIIFPERGLTPWPAIPCPNNGVFDGRSRQASNHSYRPTQIDGAGPSPSSSSSSSSSVGTGACGAAAEHSAAVAVAMAETGVETAEVSSRPCIGGSQSPKSPLQEPATVDSVPTKMATTAKRAIWSIADMAISGTECKSTNRPALSQQGVLLKSGDETTNEELNRAREATSDCEPNPRKEAKSKCEPNSRSFPVSMCEQSSQWKSELGENGSVVRDGREDCGALGLGMLSRRFQPWRYEVDRRDVLTSSADMFSVNLT